MFLYLLFLRTSGGCNHRCSHHRGRTGACGAVHVAVSRWHHALPYVALWAHKYYVELRSKEWEREGEKEWLLLDMDFHQLGA